MVSHPITRIEHGARPVRSCALCRRKTTTPVVFASVGDRVVCQRCEEVIRTWMTLFTPQQVDHLIQNH